jgi:hypothetical protein
LQTEEEAEHDHTVALLAGDRFTYPNDEHPDWTTYVNVPERTTGLQAWLFRLNAGGPDCWGATLSRSVAG